MLKLDSVFEGKHENLELLKEHSALSIQHRFDGILLTDAILHSSMK